MPNIFVIAGPNGAGKSTAAQTLLPNFLDCAEFVNADDIARGLSAFRPGSVALLAGRMMLKRLNELARQRVDFAFETTLSSRSFAPGGQEVVEAICHHPDIAAISFVGSSYVAERVYQMGCSSGKRVQAAGGAKNVMLVMPDAEPDSTIRAIMGAAFGCAGQRCMAGSIVMGVGPAGQSVVERLKTATDALRVLPTEGNPESEMGPVIDANARDRLFSVINTADSEGAQIVRDGRQHIPSTGFFVGPTLIDRVTPDMKLARTELFGPVLTIGRPESLDAAIDWINGGGYGNGAVIFTRSGSAAREFARKVQCGMIGVNVGVPAPMAVFSFSGWNRSFFGDLHVQGTEGVRFYTRQKVVFSRWDDAYVRTMGW